MVIIPWWVIHDVGIVKKSAEGDLHLWIDFYPPDRRHRDDDNLTAAFKAGRDGIADALKVNDKRFRSHPYVKDVTGGLVKVRITGGVA